jgi:hypothetical protein
MIERPDAAPAREADRDHKTLREAACRLNRDVHGAGPVILAFGNASVVDRSAGILVTKLSALACDVVEPADIDGTAGAPGGSSRTHNRSPRRSAGQTPHLSLTVNGHSHPGGIRRC